MPKEQLIQEQLPQEQPPQDQIPQEDELLLQQMLQQKQKTMLGGIFVTALLKTFFKVRIGLVQI
jgi:hypothetical protein